jgi:hypothetical protein
MISLFLLPKGVLHKLDYYRSRFFWQRDSEKKKYQLAKWSVVCCPKDQGGLGIHDLSVKNATLLGKWLFKLLTEDETWQTILKRKYIGSSALSQVLWKPDDSHFWASRMATKKNFFGLGTFSIKDGSEIRFWKDKWLGATSLCEQYLVLYSIVRHKGDTIAKVLEISPPNVSFRRDLSDQRLVSWNALLLRLANIQLQPGHDEFRWNLHENGKFLVASMYNALIQPELPIDKFSNNRIWKLKLPLCIKVFGWYLCKGVILTKDNLARRNWNGSKACVFVIRMKQLNTYSFDVISQDLYGQSSK